MPLPLLAIVPSLASLTVTVGATVAATLIAGRIQKDSGADSVGAGPFTVPALDADKLLIAGGLTAGVIGALIYKAAKNG